jgi:hypothetical protein
MSGLAMGFCFLCKQPGVTFGVMGFAVVAWIASKHSRPSLRVIYCAGWLTPYGLTCVAMLAAGCFGTFWTWTTKYAGSHGAPISTVLGNLKLLWNMSPFWIQLLVIGCVGALIYLALTRQILLWKRLFVSGFLLCGVIAVFPGFSFARHYLIMPSPGLALTIAVALAEAGRRLQLRLVPALSGMLWTITVIASLKYYFFFDDPDFIGGQRYKGNPILQARVIGDYLSQRCSPDARIAVLESEPEILFYARRKSATGFIYAYDMTALGTFRAEMEEQFKREVTESKPEYVVFVCCPFAWSIVDEPGMALADWCWRFPKTNYIRVAVADNLSTALHETVFKFDSDAANYTSRYPTFIEVYRRIPAQ